MLLEQKKLRYEDIVKNYEIDLKWNTAIFKLYKNNKTRVVISSGGIKPVLDGGGNGHSVFARSLIPLDTIENGFSKLGALGTKPLGDILFEKEVFKKIEIVFAKFTDNKKIFWGRKSKYLVKNHPLSVMEVFLIGEDE